MSKKTKRERVREIIELPYVRLTLVATVLLLLALALFYLILLIASVYVIALLFGISTVQLVVGILSATGTVASATVAFLLYRNSVKGAEISVALEDPMDVEMKYVVNRKLADPLPPGATRELFESLHFEFPLIWVNAGPTAGAITGVELKLLRPITLILTGQEGEASEDQISVKWEMKVAKLEERVGLNSVRLPVFASGSQNPMSIGDNTSIAAVTKIDLFLMDKRKDVRPPSNDWVELQKKVGNFEFKVEWKTATKGKLTPKSRVFEIRPKIGESKVLGPSVVVP